MSICSIVKIFFHPIIAITFIAGMLLVVKSFNSAWALVMVALYICFLFAWHTPHVILLPCELEIKDEER